MPEGLLHSSNCLRNTGDRSFSILVSNRRRSSQLPPEERPDLVVGIRFPSLDPNNIFCVLRSMKQGESLWQSSYLLPPVSHAPPTDEVTLALPAPFPARFAAHQD